MTPQRAPSTYQVKRGDTLYSIAWMYGLDYRQLAQINRLSSQYEIWPGQRLRLKQRVSKQSSLAQKKSSKKIQKVFTYNNGAKLRWGWPVKGQIIQGFKSGYMGNAGLDIAGFLGESVRAAAPGVVVYSGDGVRGYGNLIIIKHSDDYLSAYAFNRRNLVKVGSRVLKGQQVAVMGRNNEGKPVLHFEIRRDGEPVNPIQYLG
jgi:lipoprotein NlpD